MMTLYKVAEELARRLVETFLGTATGSAPSTAGPGSSRTTRTGVT